jgi:hypothetical protein
MKYVFLLAFCLMSLSIFSQTKKSKEERQAILDNRKPYVARDSLNYPVKYCLLLGRGKFLSNDVDISIDYGQDSSLFEDTRIRDKKGKKITFNSIIDALNYMESLGWEFVNAYVITVNNQNVYHYLLKASENTNFDFIPKTKRDFKK